MHMHSVDVEHHVASDSAAAAAEQLVLGLADDRTDSGTGLVSFVGGVRTARTESESVRTA